MPKKQIRLVSCEQCRNARLVQWGNDPLVSYCRYSNYGEIASKPRECGKYEAGSRPVEHKPKETGWWHERIVPKEFGKTMDLT